MPFIMGSAALALVASTLWIAATWSGVDDIAVTATFLVVTALCARAPISLLGGNAQLSGEFIPLIAASVIEPSISPMVAWVVLVAPASSFSVRVLGASQTALATTVASITATWALGTSPSAATYASATLAATIALVATASVQFLVYERVVWRASVSQLVVVVLGSVVATTAFVVPIAFIAVYAVASVGSVALPMLFIPLALVQYFHGLYHRKAQLTEELAEKAQLLARTNLQFAAAMVKALDARDAYTAGHSAAVAVYTRDIAREMGFDDETVRLAHLSGLLHDIGKIGVPGRVLNKTAPLDDEEYELMKTHAAMGAEILSEVELYHDIALLVRYHHERIDGRGYPDGIAGEAIPAISRMISVADTYSAMTTDRPYREGMPTEKAMSILRECRGTQLDTDFTDAFLRILIVADEAYQRGKQTDFEVEVAKHQALSEVEAEAVRIHAPHPEQPTPADEPVIPAAVDGELVEVELEREAA